MHLKISVRSAFRPPSRAAGSGWHALARRGAVARQRGPARAGGRIPHSAFALALALAIFLPHASAASEGALRDDLRARRARVMEQIGPEAMAIFWSAPARVYSHDVDYEYRQDSNLLYLTGITQEETILVLMPGNAKQREILFVREADARREHWEGHTLTAKEASERSGVETVLPLPRFEPFVAAMLSRRPTGGDASEHGRFLQALGDGRARVALLLEPQRDLNDPPGPVTQFAAKLRDRFFGFSVQDATPILAALRQIKSPYEQEVLRKSVVISSDAHRAGMRAAAAGKHEYEVEAAIEYVYLSRGAMTPGYPSIVGSGPNATILHYSESSRRMEPGDLLLVDAAANYQGYTGDITRTYPVSGTFTREQRDIYEIVFAAQEAGMRAVKIGSPQAAIQTAADEVIRAGLLKLGLITEATGQQFKIWSTHGFVHYIGIDVHDVGPRGPLAAGMAFVIEPGIYIREAALDNLPKTPENQAFIDKVRPIVARYRNIGVRIEDSFLLTDKGLEHLSATVPRTIGEIETFMTKGPGTRN